MIILITQFEESENEWIGYIIVKISLIVKVFLTIDLCEWKFFSKYELNFSTILYFEFQVFFSSDFEVYVVKILIHVINFKIQLIRTNGSFGSPFPHKNDGAKTSLPFRISMCM